MATKSSAVGSKRKATMGDKGKPSAVAKKARLDGNKKAAPVDQGSDDSEDFSDSDDGGVQLDNKKEGKPSIKGYQKTFEARYAGHNGLDLGTLANMDFRPKLSRSARQTEAACSRAQGR